MAQMTMIQAITDALRTELKMTKTFSFSEKTLVKTAAYSVRLKDCKKSLVRIVYSILHLLNLVLAVLQLALDYKNSAQ